MWPDGTAGMPLGIAVCLACLTCLLPGCILHGSVLDAFCMVVCCYLDAFCMAVCQFGVAWCDSWVATRHYCVLGLLDLRAAWMLSAWQYVTAWMLSAWQCVWLMWPGVTAGMLLSIAVCLACLTCLLSGCVRHGSVICRFDVRVAFVTSRRCLCSVAVHYYPEALVLCGCHHGMKFGS